MDFCQLFSNFLALQRATQFSILRAQSGPALSSTSGHYRHMPWLRRKELRLISQGTILIIGKQQNTLMYPSSFQRNFVSQDSPGRAGLLEVFCPGLCAASSYDMYTSQVVNWRCSGNWEVMF